MGDVEPNVQKAHEIPTKGTQDQSTFSFNQEPDKVIYHDNEMGGLKTRYRCEGIQGGWSGWETNVGECPNQTRYAEKTESNVSTSL